MKHQSIYLVKFKTLSRKLGLPLYRAVGILESIWLFAQIQARDGDLSRFSSLEISCWLEWDGDEQELVDALVETSWLDRQGEKLSIHDWDDHKPNWLKGVTKRREMSEERNSQPGPEPGPEPSTGPGPQPSQRRQPSAKPGPRPSPQPSAQLGKAPGSVPSVEPAPLPPNPTQPKPTHTQKPPPTPSTLESEFEAGWKGVEGEVAKNGINASKAAVAGARKRGLTLREARDLLAEFDEANGAYEAGALYNRFVGHLAAWPPPTRNSALQREREESHQRQRDLHAANAARVQEALESRKREQKLESTYGPVLDSMPRERVLEMIRDVFPKSTEFYLAKLPAKPPWAFIARTTLLDWLAKNSAQGQEQDA